VSSPQRICLRHDGEKEGREEEWNVQHSTSNAQRRIKEILNKEKETTNDEKSDKEHLSEIQKGGTQLLNHPPRRLGGCHRTFGKP
jgi:hypothetical protein